MNKELHVVVLMGGWSSEREVSLTSGKGVADKSGIILEWEIQRVGVEA